MSSSNVDQWAFLPASGENGEYHGPGTYDVVGWKTDPNFPLDFKTMTVTDISTNTTMSLSHFISTGRSRVLNVLGSYGVTPEEENIIYNRAVYE